MTIATVPARDRVVIGGVDTQLPMHAGAVLDSLGGVLDVAEFGTDRKGLEGLAAWTTSFGVIARVGIEGTSSCGAGLDVFLGKQGGEVVEVCRLTASDDAWASQTQPTRFGYEKDNRAGWGTQRLHAAEPSSRHREERQCRVRRSGLSRRRHSALA